MTDNEIILFKHEEFGEIRTMNIDGEPWFVSKDVALTLGYTNPTKALNDHVDKEDMSFNETLKLSRQSGAWLINESGLYSLILSSKLPSAKKFKISCFSRRAASAAPLRQAVERCSGIFCRTAKKRNSAAKILSALPPTSIFPIGRGRSSRRCPKITSNHRIIRPK